jgi:CRISPR-associated protein (TIGR03986 family)
MATRSSYNFVPLPPRILPNMTFKPDSQGRDVYDAQKHTGWIEYEIEALSPVYTRAAKGLGESAESSAFFHRFDKNQTPVLSGSGLRGAISTVFEILTYSQLRFVNNRQLSQRFFAAIESKDNPTGLRSLYAERFVPDLLAGGVLDQDEEGNWELLVSDREDYGFAMIDARDVRAGREYTTLETWARPAQKERWHTIGADPKKKGGVHKPVQVPYYEPCQKADKGAVHGWVVFPGPPVGRNPNHLRFAFIIDPTEKEDDKPYVYLVPEPVCDAYRNWSDLAHGTKFGTAKTPRSLLAQPGQPAFALLDSGKDPKAVTVIGANLMMPIPYQKTMGEVLEQALPDIKPPQYDFTESVFGRVPDKRNDGIAIKSRVFFEDAEAVEGSWKYLATTPLIPRTLLGPKPTSIQLYLEQPNKNGRPLLHWDSPKARPRGHKMYWVRRPEGRSWQESEFQANVDTRIEPLAPGARFRGRVRFENLSPEEMGALYASLCLPESLCHRVGMGKSMGLGAVRLRVLKTTLLDPTERYKTLQAGSGQRPPEAVTTTLQTCYRRFTTTLSKVEEIFQVKTIVPDAGLWRSERLHTLARLLSWQSPLAWHETEVPVVSDRQWKEKEPLASPIVLGGTVAVGDITDFR